MPGLMSCILVQIFPFALSVPYHWKRSDFILKTEPLSRNSSVVLRKHQTSDLTKFQKHQPFQRCRTPREKAWSQSGPIMRACSVPITGSKKKQRNFVALFLLPLQNVTFKGFARSKPFPISKSSLSGIRQSPLCRPISAMLQLRTRPLPVKTKRERTNRQSLSVRWTVLSHSSQDPS